MEQNFIENEIVFLTKPTLDRFLKEENPGDLIALYTFFYYTAKWQQTNIVKATSGYVKKGLKWGIVRLTNTEKTLIDMGFIQKIKRRDKNGKITGWYVKVNYIFMRSTVENILETVQKPLVDETTSCKQETNALSNGNINALSTNKETPTVAPPFSFQEELEKLQTSSWKPNKIIALYFSKKGFQFQNRAQWKSEYNRNLRPSKDLEGYSGAQIDRVMNYLEESSQGKYEWKLETVVKNIALTLSGKI